MILRGIYLSHFIEEATRRESQTNVLIAREETRANNNNTPIYLGIHINHHLSGNVGIYLSVYLSTEGIPQQEKKPRRRCIRMKKTAFSVR